MRAPRAACVLLLVVLTATACASPVGVGAHLETADSELVVAWGHSLQSHPDVIQEVLRILAEHAERAAPDIAESERDR